MSLVLIPVLFQAKTAAGTPVAGATVRAVLTVAELDDGLVVPASIFGVTDEDGKVTLNLWPNSRGANGSQYRIQIESPEMFFSGLVTLPEVPSTAWPVMLDAIINMAPYPQRDAAVLAEESAQQSALLTLGYRNEANDSKGAAQTAQGLAEGARDAAIAAKADLQTARDAALAAQTAAETAKAQAQGFLNMQVSTASGLLNTSGVGTVNRYFSVPSSVFGNILDLYRNDAGVATYIKSVPSTEMIVDNRSVAAGDNYATPPSVVGETVATATPVFFGTATLKGVGINIGHPATLAAVVRSFAAKFATALAGRKVEFYLFTPSGGSWVCTYASGLQDGSAAGVNTFNVPVPANVRVGVGDVVGAYTDAAANADGLFLATSGGNTIGPSLVNTAGGRVLPGAALTTGAGGYSTQNAEYFGVSATTAHEALFVPARWANLPNGYPRLDATGRIPAPMLPAYAAQSDTITSAATVEYDGALAAFKNVARPNNALQTWSLASPLANLNKTDVYPQGRCVVGWINGASAGLAAGTLRRVRIPPGGVVSAGGKVQMWVVRPVGALGALGATQAFTHVAPIGEVLADPSGNYREIAGLSIPVQAGDMIVMRPLSTGIAYGTGASTFNNDYFVDVALAGTSLADLANGLSGAIASGRRFDILAEVVPGPFVTGNGRNSHLVLDDQGNIPFNRYRAADNPWAGKKVAAVGTSITAGANATGNNGYIAQIGSMLNCQIDNQGVGSSGIVWDGVRALSLGATRAQLTAAGFDPAQSYETRVLGQAADLFIFDHGYNDRGMPIGTIADATESTFYGAYNKVIQALLAERPTQRFMMITPHSVYAPTTEGFHATTEAVRQAMLALAQKYCCPILDWTYTMQLSASQAATILGDTVHPNDAWHAMAARVLYRFILSMT